ncbi:ribosomal-processing cysteine protease Prp [Bacillus sp. FJAT-47783]|uniref:ribosomal-processing cysteine protease Prp n=1 Tax=Bacillus sp. FJAT-47783 TaxID=2922712 RepID=UPI001FAC6870|nr:ribosomal-processing cysteine protease Prp [Bacillus sp. FJAT-47783]
MIQVNINRSKDGLIRSFKMSGHAYYDDPGKDIVCAGASAVSIGTVNALEEIVGVVPVIQMNDKGFLQVELPDDLDSKSNEKVQLLLEGMLVSLRTIERDYEDYIRIHDTIS